MFSKAAVNEDLGLSGSYDGAEEDRLFGVDGSNGKPSRREQKQTSSGSPKKVQFDENELVRDSKRKQSKHAGAGAAPGRRPGPEERDFGHSEAVMRINELLKTLEDEIYGYYNSGQSGKRDKALAEYCQTANEAAQNLNLQDENDQRAAMMMLEHCIEVIDKNSNKLNPFSELYYATFNNMARCCNIQGAIKQSLHFLVKALGAVDVLAKEQEPGSVTAIPELSLNICNANIYLKDYPEALQYADKAITSSKQCISSLERKLDQLAGSTNSSNAERERLSQLYLSQIDLHIQGYQAKGQAYEKTKAYHEAIREFNKAKQVVEQNFGTQHKMFMELVNQVSAANVSLKTQNYSGRSEGVGVVAASTTTTKTGAQKQPSSLQSRGRAGRALKSKKQKKSTPERESVKSNGQSIDIRSEQKDHSELERVSKMSKKSIQTEVAGGGVRGSLLFDGDDTGTNKQRVHHAVTAKKRRRLGQKQDTEQVQADHILKTRATHGPARPLSAHSASLTLIQPPWNAGGKSKAACFFNKNTRYCLASAKDLWKVDHQVHPQMLGDIGFTTLNPERPKRLYYQGGRIPRQRSRSSSVRKVMTKFTSSKNDSQLYEELQKMRQQIKQREMNEIEERIKSVQQQQMDQQRNVLSALEQQKAMMLENYQKERERARLEREALLGQRSTYVDGHCHGQQHAHYQTYHHDAGYHGMPQFQQAPPAHPQYGPAVFDYNYGCWTYPYAHWYAGNHDYQQYSDEEEEEGIDTKVPSPPERHEISIQKDFDFDPKPEVNIMATQTATEAKAVTSDFAIQTQTMHVAEAATSPLKTQSQKWKAAKDENTKSIHERYAEFQEIDEDEARKDGQQEAPAAEIEPAQHRYTEDEAARIITRRCRRAVRSKREAAYRYRDIDGLLLTKKWKHNKFSGGSEILAMYAVPGPDRRCLCLRFTIFDYASKQFIYEGVYDQLKHLQEFDVQVLSDLAKASLDEIGFEKSPFRRHLLCLQSIINAYRVTNKPYEQVKLAESPRPKAQEEPIQQQVSAPKLATKDAETSTHAEDLGAQVEDGGSPVDENVESKPFLLQGTQKADTISLKKPRNKQMENVTPQAPQPRKKTKLELVVFMQSMIRAFLAKIAYRRILQAKIRKQQRLAESNAAQKDKPQKKNSKVLYRMNKKVECTQGCKDEDGGCCRRFFTVSLVKHIHDEGEEEVHQYELKARELGKRNAPETSWPIAAGLRLPQPEDDPCNNPLLGYYLPLATVIELRRSAEQEQGEADGCRCAVGSVTLLRMKLQYESIPMIPVPTSEPVLVSSKMGCVLQMEFELRHYPRHLCRVYRRIRWEDETTKKRKVHDWKIKVVQLDGAQSWDYLVVRRLPCPLATVQGHIQEHLGIQLNKRIMPAIILHILWDVGDITVFSQAYYDLTSSRFDTHFRSSHYMSQNIANQETRRRHPSLQALNAISDWQRDKTLNPISPDDWDPLYEIYIQELVPRTTTCKPWRYETPEYRKRKERVKQKKLKQRMAKLAEYRALMGITAEQVQELQLGQEIMSDSSSEDEEDETKYTDCECFWDADQLERMQLDEITIKRQYIKLTCQRTTNKQDHDHLRVEKDIARWAHPDVEYQYLMECLALEQVEDPVSAATKIYFVGLDIRANESRFRSDAAWNAFLRSSRATETYMAADQQRWRNQHFIVTVYNLKREGAGMVVEAIDVDKPHQRAYILSYDNFKGMRGEILKFYIDEKLRILGGDAGRTNTQTGFGNDVISYIEFACDPEEFKKKLQTDPQYWNWEYEDDDEDDQKEQQYQPVVVDLEAQKQLQAKALEQQQAAREKQKRSAEVIKSEWTDEDKNRAATTVQKWWRMVIERRKFRAQRKQFDIIARFHLKLKVSQVKSANLFIFIKKYKSPIHYKFVIVNKQNKKTYKEVVYYDDILFIKAQRLPGGLAGDEMDELQFINVFQEKLKIIWYPADAQGIMRMQDGFIDDTVRQVEVIHKIVEVKIHEDKTRQKMKREYHGADAVQRVATKQSKRTDSGDDSDETAISASEDEMLMIKQDIKDLKTICKMIKKKTQQLEMGCRGWFLQFDQDNSDAIELNEFVQMVHFLNIQIDDRLGIMLFRLFDRQNQGFFSYAEFTDIIDKRMRPNWKKYVKAERERFQREGLNITYPKRRKQEIVYRERIKEIPKVVVKEKIVYIDKPVEKELVQEGAQKPYQVAGLQDRTNQEEPFAPGATSVPSASAARSSGAVGALQQRSSEEYPEQFEVVEELPTQQEPPKRETDHSTQFKSEQLGVFKVNEATMMYEIHAGTDKDYYFSCSTEALRQNFVLFNKLPIGDNFEESARQSLRAQRNHAPTRKEMATELNKMLRPQFEEMSRRIVDSKKQPEEWIPTMKAEIQRKFGY